MNCLKIEQRRKSNQIKSNQDEKLQIEIQSFQLFCRLSYTKNNNNKREEEETRRSDDA